MAASIVTRLNDLIRKVRKPIIVPHGKPGGVTNFYMQYDTWLPTGVLEVLQQIRYNGRKH